MICVLGFCDKDAEATARLLSWIADIGGCRGHDCLLVADIDTPWNTCLKIRDISVQSFDSVSIITNSSHKESWIAGANSLFESAAKHLDGKPFFWLEPDAIPLKFGWLDQIESFYRQCGTPFMGPFITHQVPGWPMPYMEGIAVYPSDCWKRFSPHWNEVEPWQKTCGPVIMPFASDTPLIHHIWGEDKNPPKFAVKNVPGTEVFCLEQIKKEAVVFHRNKDGSLIRMLSRERWKQGQNSNTIESDFILVLPFCNMDGNLMFKNAVWMEKLGGTQDTDVLLAYDTSVNPSTIGNVCAVANSIFRTVQTFIYPKPLKTAWPFGPNHAFQSVARHIQSSIRRPWFWFEADATPLRNDWLQVLQIEYLQSGKPMMGPHVAGFGHCNGVCIYPPNFPQLSRKAMEAKGKGWDFEMKDETIHLTHDASLLIQHVWGLHQGRPHPYLGSAAVFNSRDKLRWLLPSAVVFHRCKDGSLINLLTQRLNENKHFGGVLPKGQTMAGVVP